VWKKIEELDFVTLLLIFAQPNEGPPMALKCTLIQKAEDSLFLSDLRGVE
jgi:hypothetical protein